MMRRAKIMRSDLVGNICGLIRVWFAAAFAAASTFSFPGMPQWLGTYIKETVSVLELKVVRRVKEIAINVERESEMIKKENWSEMRYRIDVRY